jgi:cytosine/adenosine deaminase-related metal-dependent hydrolase
MSLVVFRTLSLRLNMAGNQLSSWSSWPEKYDKLVDVHCDEIDDPASRNLEVLATMAL